MKPKEGKMYRLGESQTAAEYVGQVGEMTWGVPGSSGCHIFYNEERGYMLVGRLELNNWKEVKTRAQVLDEYAERLRGMNFGVRSVLVEFAAEMEKAE